MPNKPFFTYNYVWVNDGSWRHQSAEACAIEEARNLALKQGMRAAFKCKTITLRRLDCPDNHVNLCEHIRVTLHDT
jgi:hypothetical protein